MLEIIRLLFDFGLMVFFWMIQLVIYPSWLHFSDDALINWYHGGKERLWYFGLFLGPGQLFFAGIQLFIKPSVYTVGSFFLIILLWIYNFTVLTRLHSKIMSGEDTSKEHRRKLVSANWVRSIGVTVIFLWSLAQLSSQMYFF